MEHTHQVKIHVDVHRGRKIHDSFLELPMLALQPELGGCVRLSFYYYCRCRRLMVLLIKMVVEEGNE